MIFKGYPGTPQVESTTPGGGDELVRGSSKQLPNTRLLTCKPLKADTRLVKTNTCRLELEGQLLGLFLIHRAAATIGVL